MKPDTNSTTETLQKEVKRLSNILEQRKDDERIKANSRYLGRFYRYRNSYGGDGEQKKWWGYVSVDSIDGSGFLNVTRYEIDCYGVPRISKDFVYWGSQMGYQSVTASQARKAWDDMCDAIVKLRPSFQ